jgi:hypothetical protein
MLGYGRGVFQVGRGARTLACAGVLSCALLGLDASAGAAGYTGTSVMPADGWLNTPGFSAKVTSVAWPERNDGQEPTPGRRFVSFTLEVSARAQSASPTAPAPTLSAALRWDGSSHALSLSSILEEIQAGAGSSSTPSASASYMASVPNNTHDVDLMLSQGTFSQSFDLWTLSRVPPSPAVLYRDPNQNAITGTAAGPATLSLSNPSDGFNSSATVTLQSATLGYLAPSGTTLSPDPDQAVLSVVLDGEFPNNPNDPTGSGHYLGASAPLPASMLSFTPSGASAAPAALSDAGDTNGKASSDDGLFDATYSFLVPATLISGTLHVAAGSVSGAEFTLYTAESGRTTLDVTAPTTLALSFPAPMSQATQHTPPWVGQPDPPTASASTNTAASPAASGSSPSHGFPIWVAIVVLVLLAAGAVLFERWRRSRRLAAASVSASAPPVVVDPQAAAPAPVVVAVPIDTVVPETEPAGTSVSDVLGLAFNVIGPEDVPGLQEPLEPRLLDLLRYLAFHKHRHLRAGQILIGMWPSGSKRADLTEKTIRNYIGELRALVGVEHLPEASAKAGYILLDVPTDTERFEALARQADVLGGEASYRLRDEALRLVRGVPFCDLVDEWIGAEGIATHMSEAIAALALRLAQDRFLACDYLGAGDAARRGIVGAEDDYLLWEAGAVAIDARGDTTALRRWMADAVHHLTPAELARIEATLRGPHGDSSQS